MVKNRLIWTPKAQNDVREIYNFIASDSTRAAKAVAQRINAAARRLVRFPYLGATMEDARRQDLREILCGAYRIIYRVELPNIHVLSVYHGSRLLDLRIISQDE
jgi:toxin ParE1/3/4